jgi:hypothetical protein
MPGLNRIDVYPGAGDLRTASIRCIVEDTVTGERIGVDGSIPDGPLRSESMPLYLPTMLPQTQGRQYRIDLYVLEPGNRALRRAADSGPAVRLQCDAALERARSLRIQDRVDAADLISNLHGLLSRGHMTPKSSRLLTTADRRLAAGDPLEAYRTAIRAEQLSLPCSFLVPAGGASLGPYPVEVVAPDYKVRVLLREIDRSRAVVAVTSTLSQRVRVGYRGSWATVNVTGATPVEVTVEAGPRRRRPGLTRTP